MPTVRIEYRTDKEYEHIVERLVDELPRIVAPQMNVDGRELHDVGVGASEIIVNVFECSPLDRNINDIQITVIAHSFAERRQHLDEATAKVKKGVMSILADFDRNVSVGVSIWLVEMGYETI